MTDKLLDRLFGALVFVYALLLYVSTVAPTASFWDCGEFIAIANRLQVSHPPGAPFYMLVGRLFSMFVPTAYISLSINLMSVLASALTVLFAHLIIVHLIEEWRDEDEPWAPNERLMTLAAGAIGALTFAATDSFWFNAVEAEVYAISMFFTAIVVWLIMQWAIHIRREQAAHRIAGGKFSFGPTTSRYLVIIAYLFGLALGVHLLNLLAIFFVALIVFFQFFDQPDWSAGKRFGGLVATGVISSLCFFTIYPGIVLWLPDLMRALGSITITLVLLALLVVGAIYYTQKHRMQIANLAAICFAVVLIGYSTYALIYIRSAANPPIDENDPENVEAMVSYLKREQYGETPMFPRMHSPDPVHQREYARYTSEGEFFWAYQVNHMYWRYFLWNFVGRESDVQNAGWTTGFTSTQPTFRAPTPSEKATRNVYFALPFLLGLFGTMYHFRRDWRRAFSVGMLFFVTGLGIILYLNQTPMQPRERDYSFVASFFAFSLWIGIGAFGVLELVRDAVRNSEAAQRSAVLAAAAGLFLMVPGWMAYQNYHDHDRSGRYVATDYAYNLMQSLEENAVVFTNGDNDTFPLWYLQEVEGVRQDVRVTCLSLLNTAWYIHQLKNQASRASAPIPMTFEDSEIDRLQPAPWQPRTISLPVRKDRLIQQSEVYISPEDAAKIQSPMSWNLEGRRYSEDLNFLHVADQAALDIIAKNAQNDWVRPVYFANTTSQAGQLDLQGFFQAEGLSYRIVPIPNEDGIGGRIVPEIVMDRFNKFRFTNLDNPDVYFDENIRRMIDNYRITFGHAAEKMARRGRKEDAKTILDTLMKKVPFDVIPGDTYSTLVLRQAYEAVGDQEGVLRLTKLAEPYILDALVEATTAQTINRLRQYIQNLEFTYLESGDFEAAAAFTKRIADATGDSTYRQSADQLRALYQQFQDASEDTTDQN